MVYIALGFAEANVWVVNPESERFDMKAPLTLDLKFIEDTVSPAELDSAGRAAEAGAQALLAKSGLGSDFLGWVHLPKEALKQAPAILKAAKSLAQSCTDVVCVGIGGSYLGARAAIESLGGTKVSVHYAGHHLSPTALSSLMDSLDPKKTGIVVISKSGTTTEPAVAFRVLKNWLEKGAGRAKAAKRIVAVTDARKGALRGMANKEKWATFVIPDDVGGRYSVLTPVGLLPIAASGLDIKSLLQGAQDAATAFQTKPFSENLSMRYAAARNLLYRKGKTIEVMANFRPELHYVSEWWKQLYGESEGKDGKGIFPAGVDFTTDLHSMGQYLQEGKRSLFETILWVQKENEDLKIPRDPKDPEGLNFLAGKNLSWVNEQAMRGTAVAHHDGGVPVMKITLETLDEYTLGYLFYFFEFACGVSGYLLGVNPFDQPGVEAYKKNMFALLGKKGFENLAQKLKSKGI
jgi:glucose-6-phosphate isomerase